MRREQAHDALLGRVEAALASAEGHDVLSGDRDVVSDSLREARAAIDFVLSASDDIRQLHARRLTAWLADITEAALLLEQAAAELKASGSARKAAVARLFIREHLSSAGNRGITDDRSTLDLYDSVVRYAPLDTSAIA
jgi:hypothetical protein